jgi:formyltetrahydrofolate deformylase
MHTQLKKQFKRAVLHFYLYVLIGSGILRRLQMAEAGQQRLILRFTSPDRPGILAAVAPIVAEAGWDVREADIYGDPDTGVFFVRMLISGASLDRDKLESGLHSALKNFESVCELIDADKPMKTIIAVSGTSHCLNDILHKVRIGVLPIEIGAIVSNHNHLQSIAQWREIPFVHLPVSPETRKEQEKRLLDLMAEQGAELLVLARYMQILSNDTAQALSGRCINIHHSFLPSFKGARPYHQAHARGVKQIGATAHYVTSDLDEGPIIEQDVRRVSHAVTPERMVQIGQEVEASVLSRAVLWHAERKVFLNGARTVVFN